MYIVSTYHSLTNKLINIASYSNLYNITLGTLLSLLIATSILGNILVCIAIWTDKNLRKVLFFLQNISQESCTVLNCRFIGAKNLRIFQTHFRLKSAFFYKFEMDLGRLVPASKVAGGHTIPF
jgi:hypothetical protein